MDYYFYDYDHALPEDDERIVYKFTEKDISEVFINCIEPSFRQIAKYVVTIISWNFTFRFLWALFVVTGRNIFLIGHIISICCGFSVLYITVGDSVFYLIALAILGYGILIGLFSTKKFYQIGPIFLGINLAILTICELFYNDPKIWHRIRGIQMISTMKIVSVAFDLDKKKLNRIPNLVQYMGYILCPANSALGPWVAYDEYLATFTGPALRVMGIGWAILNGTISVIFLILSNCIVSMICSDLSWKWLVAYRDALAFRCSHYFVSILSQATMCAAGLIKPNEESQIYGVIVTRPWEIEIPRSLVTVVTNWNVPMHRWLKTYVFKSVKPHGTPLAIFATYLVSSFLHGLNTPIYLVLLSLGVYTYVEYQWRQKFSQAFDACVLTTACKQENCGHSMNQISPISMILNTVFGLLTIVNLAYLGVIFEASSNLQDDEGYSFWHAWNKWNNLNFAGHWMAVGGDLLKLSDKTASLSPSENVIYNKRQNNLEKIQPLPI